MNRTVSNLLPRAAKRWLPAALLVALFTFEPHLHARSFRVNMLPNGSRFSCSNCHLTPGGPRNAFGLDVQARVTPGGSQPFWEATLAAMDSDGDGWTNGEELGDPDGDGVPTPGALVTNPGDASSHPPEPEPIVIDPAGFQVAGSAATLTWTGGKGPFLVQFLPAIGGEWLDVLTTADRSAHVPLPGGHGFFRVQDAPGREVTMLTVSLSGQHTAPPNASAGVGLGFISLSDETLVYYIAFEGLDGEATAAHIHGPAAVGENAGVLVPLEGASGKSGVLTGRATIDATTAEHLRTGQTYVNIHTAVAPAGEIRGQVVPSHWQASMDGIQAVPQVSTAGTGEADFVLVGNQLFWTISWQNLSSEVTAAHIHGPAAAGETAGVLLPLPGLSGTAGQVNGTDSLSAEALDAFLGGLTYVNIHTQANPPGEIRGQIEPAP